MEDRQQRVERLFRELLARLGRQSAERRKAFESMLDGLAKAEETEIEGKDNEQADQ